MNKLERYLHRNTCFNKKLGEIKSPYSIRTKEKLLNIARENKILVNSGEAKRYKINGLQRFIEHDKFDSLVSVSDKNNYLPILAHEIGHAITLKERPWLESICKKARTWENKQRDCSWFKNWFMATWIFRFVVWSESLATRKGLELLEKCGYEGLDLQAARRYLKLALGTYVSSFRYYRKHYIS
jgi:hypothetical protein